MSDQWSFIDRILIKFSYTAKIRFILSLGYFTLLVLLVMNFILLLHPLKNFQKQETGLEHIKQLSSIFEKIHGYLLRDHHSNKTHDEFLLETIGTDLHKFMQQVEDWVKSENKDQLEDFKIKFTSFNEYWDQLSSHLISLTDEKQIDLINGFYSSYKFLMEQISVQSDLTFNIDTGTSYLVNVINQDLPDIQKETANVLLRKKALLEGFQKQEFQSAEFHLAKENLITSNKQLLEEGNKAIESTSPWLEGERPDLLPDLNHFTDTISKYVKLIDIPLNSKNLELSVLELSEYSNELLTASFKLNQKFENLLQLTLYSEQHLFNSIMWKCLFILFLGGSIVAGLYLTRVIRHPVEKLVHAAQELSKGNIAIRVPITTKDEVALMTQAFNQMAEYFEKILKKAATIIDRIFVTSTTISSYTKEFESNMNTQERIVRQIASHAGSLQKGEEEFVEVLQRANKVASITGTLVQMGHGNLHEMESIMHEMLSASSNVVTTLSSLREKLVDINQVIFAIVKIADQSNLLSLNTAIRATKSGSEGRGFVIIADKIREMAEQIAFATLDIEKVVEDIVGTVQITVQEVDRFSEQILTQVKETTEIGSHLKHLIDMTQEQVTDFENINDGMQDQTKGIIAINQVIEELRISVQESAFSVRKLYLEIEYLYDSSHTLQDTIKKFVDSEKKQ